MNVLLMARIIAKTGVGNHVKQLSEELANQGHSVWVVASTNEMNVGKQMFGGGCRLYALNCAQRTLLGSMIV